MRSGRRWSCILALVFAGFFTQTAVQAADWPRFRGPNGSGISTENKSLPTKWSDTKNLKWKAELPGPGNSNPIVAGDRVFVTCWTGYADDSGRDGSLEQLKRHLVCIDRNTGKTLWDESVDAVLPEDDFRGMFAENGYATHTPVCDGERVYAFFGKSGVHAYDMEGKHLWKADVGTDLDRRGWGSASSPVLYKDYVIVTAAVESHAIIALDKKTGKQVWKQEADGFGSTWGTPILVDSGDRTELVIGVPYEIWSLNPDNGKLLWYCESINTNSMCSSLIAHDGVVYGIESGPGGGGGVAVKVGGKGDVTRTHKVWSNRSNSRISTPVIHDGLLYYMNSGVAHVLDLEKGRSEGQARLKGSSRPADNPPDNRDDNRGERPGGRGFGGRSFGGFGGGRFGGGGGQDYSSPIIADGKIYYARRNGDVFVLKLGPKLEQLAVNRLESADGDFNATPAVSNGELFLRSSRTLFCVANDAKTPPSVQVKSSK